MTFCFEENCLFSVQRAFIIFISLFKLAAANPIYTPFFSMAFIFNLQFSRHICEAKAVIFLDIKWFSLWWQLYVTLCCSKQSLSSSFLSVPVFFPEIVLRVRRVRLPHNVIYFIKCVTSSCLFGVTVYDIPSIYAQSVNFGVVCSSNRPFWDDPLYGVALWGGCNFPWDVSRWHPPWPKVSTNAVYTIPVSVYA